MNRTAASARCWGYFATALLPILLTACASSTLTGDRVPESLVMQANVGGYRNIRFYSDDPASLQALARDRISDIRRAYARTLLKGLKVEINYLSISGGGSDGAFGAGFLTGWTASGTRPKFDVVTGISTGAMIAPLAFLGPAYDGALKEAYTTISTADVEDTHPLPALLGMTDSLSSNSPLQKLIARYVTQQMMQEIATEYRKGRMLLIGTTNLDAQRPAIWDIGAIATSGRLDSLALVRRIILASAAIPGAFPPVQIQVNADGKDYSEIHVDGGVTRQVFLFPPGYDPKEIDAALGWKPTRHAYIIRNGKIDPHFEVTQLELLPIAARSISTLIKTQGVGDLYRIYIVCLRNRIDYNVAYVPGSFSVSSTSAFDPKYMNALFDLAYRESSSGFRWHKLPPGLDPRQD
jgi:Patatin-like phospholipase